ncbi:MAG: class I SAM-dependent rRNA methyltransferase [bacterium]|nr:class I SAM-dependent rRNA methyltransferase [bacterium]
MYQSLMLKPDKLASISFRHPWIFSGALVRRPEDLPHGSIVYVTDPNGVILGTGTYSAHGTIAIRVFEFGKAELHVDWFIRKFKEAEQRRHLWGFGGESATTGYRVVFGESDSVPGLVVDRYDSTLVIQLSTAGSEHLRPVIVDALIAAYKPKAIIERSDVVSRRDEQLNDISNLLYGEHAGRVEFAENGLKFLADPMDGQKTGFYLDQKDLRRQIRVLARGRSVLNLFSYTGSAGVAAIAGGATRLHQLDASEPALAQCGKHLLLNGFKEEQTTTESCDIFKWLGANPEERYDMVLIDPPALIKSQRDAEAGRRAYHFVNRAAMRLINPGGLLITSSCSAFFTEDDFSHTLRRASVQNGIHLHLLQVVRQSVDHPVSIYFPESSYLKSYICQVG